MNEERYWNAEEVLAGVVERPAVERGSYPKYQIHVDGERHCYINRRALNKALEVIYAKRPEVFINAGKGVTINFENA